MADCLIQGRGRSSVGESVLEARRLRQLGIREYIPVCVRARESMQVEPQSKTWGTPMVVIDLRAPYRWQTLTLLPSLGSGLCPMDGSAVERFKGSYCVLVSMLPAGGGSAHCLRAGLVWWLMPDIPAVTGR